MPWRVGENPVASGWLEESTDLEHVCPLLFGFETTRNKSFPIKTRVNGFQVYTYYMHIAAYTCIYIYIHVVLVKL